MRKLLQSILFLMALLVPSGIMAQATLLDENFQNVPGSLPDGWTVEPASGYKWTIMNETSGNAAAFYDTRRNYNDVGNSSLVTSWVDLSTADWMLSFKYKNDGKAGFAVYIIPAGGEPLGIFYSSGDTIDTDYHLVEYDLSPYLGSRIMIQFFAQSNSFAVPDCDNFLGCDWAYNDYRGIYIDDVRVQLKPACAAVNNLYTTEITPNSASLVWGTSFMGAVPAAYIVTLKDLSFRTIKEVSVPFGMHTFTGLEPNTSYYVYVRGDCTSTQQGMSTTSTKFKITTDGREITLPYHQDFDIVTDIVPEGWRWSETADGNTYVQSYVAKDNMGKSLALESKASKIAAAITPTILHAANDMEITFSYYPTAVCEFGVGILSNKTDMTTYEEFCRITTTSAQTKRWANLTVPTGSTMYGDMHRCALCIINYTSNAILYVDDVDIHAMPACPTPDNLALTKVTGSTAEISWNSWGVDGNVEIELSTNNGTTIVGTYTVAATESEYTLTSLTAQTTYSVRLRTKCSVETTAWTKAITFTTDCNPVNSSWTESFEYTEFPVCWRREVLTTSDPTASMDMWFINTNSTYASAGSKSLAFYEIGPGSIGGWAAAISPAIIIPQGDDNVGISFDMWRTTAAHYTFTVMVNTEPTVENAVPLKTLAGMHTQYPSEATGNKFYTYECAIPSQFKGKEIYILFVGQKTSSATMPTGGAYAPFYGYFDNIKIKNVDRCPFNPTYGVQVTDYGQSYGVISWEDENYNEKYRLTYTLKDESNNVIASGTEDITKTEYGFYNLASNIKYTVTGSVRALCVDGTYQSNEVTFDLSFSTQCAIASLPYNETFDSYPAVKNQNAAFNAGSILPACWTVTSNRTAYSSSGDVYVKTPWYISKSKAAGGSNSFCYTGEVNTDYASVDGRPLVCMGQYDIPSNTATMTFQYYQTAASMNCTMEVYASSSARSISGARLLGTFDAYTDGIEGWRDAKMVIPSGKWFIIIAAPQSADPFIAYIDELSIKETKVCEPLTSFGTSEVRVHDASVYIDEMPEVWEIAFNDENDLSTAEIIRIDNGFLDYTFNDLTPNVTYYAWARNICASDKDSSDWSRVVTFTPECDAFAVNKQTPYVDGFESSVLDECYAVNDAADLHIVTENVASVPQGTRALAVSASEKVVIKRLLNLQKGYYSALISAMSPASGISYTLTLTNKKGAVVNNLLSGTLTNSWADFSQPFEVTSSGDYYLTLTVNTNDASKVAYFDFLTIQMEDCLAPASITVSDITKNSAVVTVVAAAGIAWDIKVASSDINPETQAGNVYSQTVTSLSPITLTGLTKSTTYYVYARSKCEGNAYSDWTKATIFTTNCDSYALPFSDTFENNETNFKCWTYTTNGVTERATTKTYSGSYSLHNLGNIIVSPQMEVTTLAGHTLNGQVYATAEYTTIDFGVVLDPNDITTYEKLTTLTIKVANTWIEFNIDYDLVNDPNFAEWKNAQYFAIVPDGSVDFYFDNISFDVSPSCGKPANVGIGYVAGTYAEINFTSNAPSFKYKVYQIDDVQGDVYLGEFTSTSNPITISGLQTKTKYWVEMAAVCQDGTTTPYIYVGKFETLCDPFALPWSEDFETNPSLDDQCYLFHSVYDETRPYDIVRKTTVGREDILSLNGNYSLQINSNGDPVYMSLPLFTQPTSNLKLEFKYRYMLGMATLQPIEIGVIDEVERWETFKTIYQVEPSIAYNKVSIEVGRYLEPEDGNKILCFRVPETRNGNQARIAIDDLFVNTSDGCEDIVSIETTYSAPREVTFIVDHPSATSCEYKLFKNGSEVANGTANSTNVRFTNLDDATEYTVRLRAMCSPFSGSPWREIKFKTMASAAELPYTTNFSDPNDNSQWTFVSGDYDMSFFIGGQGAPNANSLWVGTEADDGTQIFGYGCFAHGGSQTEKIYAYRPIYLPQGRCNIDISYAGFTNSSLARVVLAPVSMAIDGSDVLGVRAGTMALADGVIAADGEILTISDEAGSWTDKNRIKYVANGFDVPVAGFYNIVAVFFHYSAQEGADGCGIYGDSDIPGSSTPAGAGVWNTTFFITSLSISGAPCSQTTGANVFTTATSAHITPFNTVPVNEMTYRLSTTNDVTTAPEYDVETNSTIDIENLITNQKYYMWLKPTCAKDNNNVNWFATSFTVKDKTTPLPYNMTFETAEERNAWTIKNSTTNAFVYSNDPEAIKTGNYALYPSDNGSKWEYTCQDAGVNVAYTKLVLNKGNYSAAFDYRTGYHELLPTFSGSVEDDPIVTAENANTGPLFARVILVPTTVTPKSVRRHTYIDFGDGHIDQPDPVQPEDYDYMASPASVSYENGVVAVDAGYSMTSEQWSRYEGMFTINNAGEYYLVVMWVNSGDEYYQDTYSPSTESSTVVNYYYKGKPFTIDNIYINVYEEGGNNPEGCNPPNLEIDLMSAEAVQYKYDNENGDLIYYTYNTTGTTPTSTDGCQTTNAATFRVTGLQELTTYYIFACRSCGAQGTTTWTKRTYTTPCYNFIKVSPTNPYSYGFEDYDPNTVLGGNGDCWRSYPGSTSDGTGMDLGYAKAIDNQPYFSMTSWKLCAQAAEGKMVAAATAYGGYIANTIYLEKGHTYAMKAKVAGSSSSYGGPNLNFNFAYRDQLGGSWVPFGNNTKVELTFLRYGSNVNTTSWKEITGTFVAPTSGLYDIGVQYSKTMESDWCWAFVDAIEIETSPVAGPSSIYASVSGVNITATWNTVLSADEYEVQIVNANGDVIDSGTTTETTWTGTGSAAQTFTVRVRAVSGGEVSTWASTTVSTSCGAYVTPPYTLSFPNGMGDARFDGSWHYYHAPCWDVEAAAYGANEGYYAGSTWNSGLYAGYEGWNYKGGTAANNWYETRLVSPLYNINKEGYILKFQYALDGVNAPGIVKAFNVGISLDGQTIVEQVLSTNDLQGGMITKDLSKYAGRKIYVIAFVVETGGMPEEPMAYLYDFSIKCYDGEQNTKVKLCKGELYEDEHFLIFADELNAGDYHYYHYKVAESGSGECDALFSVDVNVGTSNTILMADTICYGSAYNKNGFVNLTQPGVYEIGTPNPDGCDDIIHLNLVAVPNHDDMSVTICEGERYVIGGQVLTESGSYEVPIPSRWGCDIMTTVHLNVRQTEFVTNETICEGGSVRWGGVLRNTTGTYVINRKTMDGECDSILILNLVVAPLEETIDTFMCQGGSIVINNQIYTEPQTIVADIINEAGCNATITYNIKFREDVVGYTDDYACEGKEFNDWDYQGFITEDTEIVFHTKTKVGDCDSTVYVTVHYLETEYSDDYKTITEGDVLEWNNDTYTVAGDYVRTMTNDYGCDSVVTLHLTVNPKQAVENAYMLPLTIAPNPIVANGSSFVSHQFSELEKNGLMVYVTTTSGQVVRSFEPATYPIEIDKLYASGVYYVRIVTGTGETYIGKLVVK